MFPFIINYFTIKSGLLKSVLEIVEQPREAADNIVDTLHDSLLQRIKLRWLSLYNSIDRLLKVYEPLSSYFCDINNENEDITTCPPMIKAFFSSNMSKCTLYFLHQRLFDIQTKNLELQQYSTSIADLHRIITSLFKKKLNDRLEQTYFGYNTRLLLNSMSKDEQEKATSSFTKYLSNIIKYINKYYSEHSLLAET
ncbi:unnamed protein product [Rotaria sordida]|uniref:Uncharacterized protein n=1 Tax=Rotaria sordida TaxID=392033 RepID=A0A819J708_9BILA|nr:unnamed protein product [Rotaria sordida]CAF3939165.1 unnamed protein product [Rotaria sordida]